MTVWTLMGVAVVAVLSAVVLRQTQPALALVFTIAAGVMILIAGLSELSPLIDRLTVLLSYSAADTYRDILFKAIGIGLVTQFTTDVCRDAGETALAGKTEFAGRVLLLLCGLPLFEHAASLIQSIIRGEAVIG